HRQRALRPLRPRAQAAGAVNLRQRHPRPGQLSLAKYLLIVAHEDDPDLDIHDVPAFLRHLLERLDPRSDLHFQTCTTIDTLDYSGRGLNAGSKVVLAAAGPRRRVLPTQIPSDLKFPEGFREPRVCLPGVLAIQAPKYPGPGRPSPPPDVARFCEHYRPDGAL